jgi:hypothetical protein
MIVVQRTTQVSRGDTGLTSPVIVMPDARVQTLFQQSLGRPHEARVLNVYLGGNANYAVDREFAARQLAKLPELGYAAVQNRKWTTRAVEHMARSGIRQFVDFGAGLPAEGAPHEILERYTDDECHVVYVDHDPMAAAHAHLILEDLGKADAHKVIQADIQNHVALWEAIVSTGVINPREPVGLIMAAVWHFVPDEDDPYQAAQFYRDVVASGSQLAISHSTLEGVSSEMLVVLKSVIADYDSEVTSKAFVRPLAEIQPLFGDWTMVPEGAGLQWLPEWTSPLVQAREVLGGIDPTRSLTVCGVAEKR